VIGWLSPTVRFDGQTFALCSPIAGLGELPLAPVLCFYVVALYVVGAIASGGIAREQRVVRDRLHVQAWQLRQLVP